MVFVFSSPGAGKSTRIKPLLQKSFALLRVVEIDELKAFIPDGDNIDKTADDWFCRIVDGALDLKYNIIIFRQRSMLQLKQTRDYLKKARQNGYRRKSVFWRWTNSEAVWEWFTAMSLPLKTILRTLPPMMFRIIRASLIL